MKGSGRRMKCPIGAFKWFGVSSLGLFIVLCSSDEAFFSFLLLFANNMRYRYSRNEANYNTSNKIMRFSSISKVNCCGSGEKMFILRNSGTEVFEFERILEQHLQKLRPDTGTVALKGTADDKDSSKFVVQPSSMMTSSSH